MLLAELYQEEKGSSFTHNKEEYDLNKLLKIVDHFKARSFAIKDLKWILKYGTTDPERLKKANTKIPIIVTYSDKQLVVVDGFHRLCKAVEQNKTHINGKFVYKDVLDTCKEKK